MPPVYNPAHSHAPKHGSDVDQDQRQGRHTVRCAQRLCVRREVDGRHEVAEALEDVAELQEQEGFVLEKREVEGPVVRGLGHGETRLEEEG